MKRVSLSALPIVAGLLLLVPMVLTGTRALLLPGEALPQLTVRRLDGTRASLRTEGRTIILVFSAECPHCQQMLLQASDLYAAGGRRAPLLGISLSDHAATLGTTLRLHLPFPVLLGEPSLVHERWKVQRVPVLIVVNSGGTVAECWPGPRSYRHLERLFREFASAPRERSGSVPGMHR